MVRDEMALGAMTDASGDDWEWDDDPTWPEEGEVIEEMWGLFRSASEFHGRSGWFEGSASSRWRATRVFWSPSPRTWRMGSRARSETASSVAPP